MAALVAKADPHKRLFISLITRDISLADAVLDLLDNAINSTIQALNLSLSKPSDYIALLSRKATKSIAKVSISFDKDYFEMTDTAGGITLADAQNRVFMFGRADDDEDQVSDDTLSVYGIGMKRAIFKIGDHIKISSRHRKAGFKMNLRVRKWEKLKQDHWSIPIQPLPFETGASTGTDIYISDLYPDISKRISDGTFEGELVRKIARTYSYFLDRVVAVEVNGKAVVPSDMKFGENVSSDHFSASGVSCAVIAGIGIPDGKFHVSEKAGWYVFCNGRAVAFADKTALTGWGGLMPTFQPKHRPFLGLVFFSADDPEKLPWTTTKSSINEESAVWQHALRVMHKVGKQITSFLDSRYTDDGTEISSDELADVAGKSISAFSAPSETALVFKSTRRKPRTTSIQIKVLPSELDEVREYLGRRTMPNTEVGRHIFDYFLNEVVRD